jgi:hypothetical protein
VVKRAIKITGPFRGLTGHDHHVRCMAHEMRRQGLAVELRDFPDWSPSRLPWWRRDWSLEFLGRSVGAAHHLHFCMPHQVHPTPGCRNFNYTMFEAGRIPRQWVEASNACDRVIVPTESSRKAWTDSGVPVEKMAVCPLGVDAGRFHPGVRALSLKTADGRRAADFRIRFLNVAEATHRKNLTGLLRVWLRATAAADDAVLILKPGFYAPGARDRFFSQLRHAELEAGKDLAAAAPVILLEEGLVPGQMPKLYVAATHYWSMSRGEGFDLPMMEAAASGLQLLAPAHSAYLDYLHPGIAHLLPVHPEKASVPEDPLTAALFEDADWWRPSEEAAVERVRGLVRGEVPATGSAREFLLPRYGWADTVRLLTEIVFA